MKTIKTLEKGLIIIILYTAYLLDFLFNVLKIDMEIILLSKPDPRVEYAHLC